MLHKPRQVIAEHMAIVLHCVVCTGPLLLPAELGQSSQGQSLPLRAAKKITEAMRFANHAVFSTRSGLWTDTKGRETFVTFLWNDKHSDHFTNPLISTLQPPRLQHRQVNKDFFWNFSILGLDLNFNRKQLFTHGPRTQPSQLRGIQIKKKKGDRSSSRYITRVLVPQLVAVLVHMEVHESLGTNFHKLW